MQGALCTERGAAQFRLSCVRPLCRLPSCLPLPPAAPPCATHRRCSPAIAPLPGSWRWGVDAEGNRVRESNARFVRWSDGSLQLVVGDEVMDVEEIDTT